MIDTLTEDILHKKTPQELTRILYKVIIERYSLAIIAINEMNYEQANIHLQKCNDLLYRLGAGLNYEAGIIADQLDAIYQYLAEKTVEANKKKDTNIIEEMIVILTNINDAWGQAMVADASQLHVNRNQKTVAYDKAFEAVTVDIRE